MTQPTSKPRIAIILGRLVIGGTTMDTLAVAKYLQHDHELMLITGGGDKDEFEAAFLTEHLPRVKQERIEGFSGKLHPLQDLRAYFKVRKAIRRFKPHIVHTHTAKAGLIGRLAAKAERVPVIIHTYHGMMFHSYYGRTISHWIVRVERFLAKRTDGVIAISKIQKDQLANTYRICPNERIHIVPLGIEVDHFADPDGTKRKEMRSKYYVQDDEVAISIVSRIVPIKDHSFFLKMAAALLHKGLKARFFIIGDGSLRKRLQAEATALQLDNTYFPEDPRPAQVTFTSWIKDIDKAIAGSDIIALTSFNEGTPVSLMEAQAAGRPVIATKAGGIDDIVMHGASGYTVAKEDAASYEHYLTELTLHKELREAFGQKGRALATARFQIAQQVTDQKALYHDMLQQKGLHLL